MINSEARRRTSLMPLAPPPSPGGAVNRGSRAASLGLYDVIGLDRSISSRLYLRFSPFMVPPVPNGEVFETSEERGWGAGVYYRPLGQRDFGSFLYQYFFPMMIPPPSDGVIERRDRVGVSLLYVPSFALPEPVDPVPEPQEQIPAVLVRANTYAIVAHGRPRGMGRTRDRQVLDDVGMTVVEERVEAGQVRYTGYGDRFVLSRMSALPQRSALPHWSIQLPVGAVLDNELILDWTQDLQRVLVAGAVPPGLRS